MMISGSNRRKGTGKAPDRKPYPSLSDKKTPSVTASHNVLKAAENFLIMLAQKDAYPDAFSRQEAGQRVV